MGSEEGRRQWGSALSVLGECMLVGDEQKRWHVGDPLISSHSSPCLQAARRTGTMAISGSGLAPIDTQVEEKQEKDILHLKCCLISET